MKCENNENYIVLKNTEDYLREIITAHSIKCFIQLGLIAKKNPGHMAGVRIVLQTIDIIQQ